MSKILYVPVRDLKKLIKEPEGSLKAYEHFNHALIKCKNNPQIENSGIGDLRKGLMSGIVTIEIREDKLPEKSDAPFDGPHYTLSAQDIHMRTTDINAVIPCDALHPTATDMYCKPANIETILNEADEHEAAWIKFKDAFDRTDATRMPSFDNVKTCRSFADAYGAHGFCNKQMDNAHSMHLQSMMKELARVGTLDVVAKMDNIIETYYNKLPAHENIAPQDSVIAMRDTLQEFSENAQTDKEKALFDGLAQINARYAEYAYEKFERNRDNNLDNLIAGAFRTDHAETIANGKEEFLRSPKLAAAIQAATSKTAGNHSQAAGDDSNIGAPETSDNFDDVGDDR